jgi:hypothetical protein
MNEGKRIRHPPCSHPGCYSHITHPCEGCGRIQGYLPGQEELDPLADVKAMIEKVKAEQGLTLNWFVSPACRLFETRDELEGFAKEQELLVRYVPHGAFAVSQDEHWIMAIWPDFDLREGITTK